jgi:glycogen debranching enzyme
MTADDLDPILQITGSLPSCGDPDLDRAAAFAVENMRRTMKRYEAGYGMTHNPPRDILVGRDTGWMAVGLDYVAPAFAAAALDTFRRKQFDNGRIPEVVVGTTGHAYDYDLNAADNTPLWAWGVWHHWSWHGDRYFPDFHAAFMPAMRRAGDHMIAEMERGDGLLRTIPSGDGNVFGIAGWRNIIEGRIQAGAVTEINSLSAFALEKIGEFTGDSRYSDAGQRLADNIRRELRRDDGLYLLKIDLDGMRDAQVTADMIFPVLFEIASEQDSAVILDRLSEPDFWSLAGIRTVPASDPAYDPAAGAGLLGGSWPNPTLWYAAACGQRGRREACLYALCTVAAPVLATEEHPWQGTKPGEFCEYFHGDNGRGLGMPLSPWVPPTFLWALMEGLL